MSEKDQYLIQNDQYSSTRQDDRPRDSIVLLMFIKMLQFGIMLVFFFVLSFSILSIISQAFIGIPKDYTPEQVHLSLGSKNGEYYVTWMTQHPGECFLTWSLGEEKRYLLVQADKFEDKELERPEKLKTTSYRAKMTVEPGEHHNYKISCHKRGEYEYTDEHRSTRVFSFLARDYEQTRLNVIFYGDLGLKNGQSIPRLTQEVQNERTDLIIHNGDFAYDLDTNHGKYGDEFMRLIEPIASVVPYQTSVGNHEIRGNFSHYNYRFTMINRGPKGEDSMNNFFYSYNLGPIHFVAFSTEFYYFLSSTGIDPLVNQYNWLKEDLAKASSPEERAKRPWIIVYGHRPMYCSSRDNDDCSKDNNILRKGLPFTNGAYALEKLFYDFGVDVEIYSHEHQYERFLPLFDGQVFNGTLEDQPYTNPRAPVHIISGSAGCQEKLDPFKGKGAPGSVKRIADYGYSRLKVVSSCELKFEQISDDQFGKVVDSFTLKKDRQNFPDSKSDISYRNCERA